MIDYFILETFLICLATNIAFETVRFLCNRSDCECRMKVNDEHHNTNIIDNDDNDSLVNKNL